MLTTHTAGRSFATNEFLADFDCIRRRLRDKGNMSRHFIDILKCRNTDPYLTRLWRCFLRRAHSDFAALRLIVGAASALAIHCFIAEILRGVPGNAGDCISLFAMIFTSFLLTRLCIARIALVFVISRVRVCIYSFYTITVKIQLFTIVFPGQPPSKIDLSFLLNIILIFYFLRQPQTPDFLFL